MRSGIIVGGNPAKNWYDSRLLYRMDEYAINIDGLSEKQKELFQNVSI